MALVTAGRIGRFMPQFLFNCTVFFIFVSGDVFSTTSLNGIGGIVGVSFFTTLSSQGAQYLALTIFNRGIGDQNRNVLIALSANIVITALATTGLPFVKPAFLILSSALGVIIFGIGLAADIRAKIFPKRGIGVFLAPLTPFTLLISRSFEMLWHSAT